MSSTAYTSVSSAAQSSSIVPMKSEIDKFYEQLNDCHHKAAILSLIPPYSDNYMCKTVEYVVPSLNSLYDVNSANLSLSELITLAEVADYTVKDSESELIELATRGQSKNSNWYTYRTGRITASKMKSSCLTKINNPSVSLLKAICYPEENRFSTVATNWGIVNEKKALQKYKIHMSSHEDSLVEDCGFIINTQFCYVGSSPDGLVSCKCCGSGVVEIKCPYKYRFMTVGEYLETKECCLESSESGIELKQNHAYYYQVQAQMHICDVKYCDFVVCTFPCEVPSIFTIRIFRDAHFWEQCLKKCHEFFKLCVLPELLGKFYTRQPQH